MVVIEEICCELEDNPGEGDELALEDNPGEGDDVPSGADDGLQLEDNLPSSAAAAADFFEDGEEVWEIPYAESDREALLQDEVLEVRLFRKGEERLGLVLDATNVVVALREGTPAAQSAQIFVGDTVLAVQGVACSAERRVAQLLRELPDAAVYAFTVRRALSLESRMGAIASEVVDHGPLLTPEEQERQLEREVENRHKMREEIAKSDDVSAEEKAALQQHLAPRNLHESKYMSANSEPSPAAKKQMEAMWHRQARSHLANRFSAAEMLKDEGNDKFSEGQYQEALEEYDYALELFKYEMANLCRDQEAAELGDHKRGLGSDDLPAINKLRVPCLLNSAACHLKLGSPKNLTKALECCAEVLQTGPPAAQRAKAHFRVGQAHFALQNYREAWTALVQAQELNASSREVRQLLAKVSYELKQLKVAERESREGMMGTELNHKQIFKLEKVSYAQKLAMLRKLLPAEGEVRPGGAPEMPRGKLEALLELVAAKGWSNMGGEDQMRFAALWSAAQPRLGTSEVRDGRDAGVYPPRDEERIFGQNLPTALMSKPFPQAWSWLSPSQKQYARRQAGTGRASRIRRPAPGASGQAPPRPPRPTGLARSTPHPPTARCHPSPTHRDWARSTRHGRADSPTFPNAPTERCSPHPSRASRRLARGLALTIWKRGAEDLDPKERRLCEGLELLSMSTHTAPHHARPLCGGGAQLILSAARAHLWPFPPPTLRAQRAVMGAEMGAAELRAVNGWARRPLSAGEVGILASNRACWQHALDAGWEWSLVLEDDAAVSLSGGALQLLAMLPELVAAAQQAEPEWQLLCLTPHGLEPFYDMCTPEHIPSLYGEAAPSWARKPKTLGDSGWRRVGPTFHAFGWIYRAPLMKQLVGAWKSQAPPLNPLDVWVWEVMATNGVLGKALAPLAPLVGTRDTPGGATSLREQQQGRLV